MSIVKSIFDKTASGREIYSYTMTNKSGISVTVLEFGGIINKLMLPDCDGNVADCICGFDTVEDYLNGGGYQGALIGRYCNRIAGGTFVGSKLLQKKREQKIGTTEAVVAKMKEDAEQECKRIKKDLSFI